MTGTGDRTRDGLTPRVIFRALLGVLLFLCGIVLGVWLIIRYRRQERS